MRIRVDKFSKKPLYLQIKDGLLELIIKKELRHKDLVPTEKEICKIFNLSRSVVRRAYEELIKDGYLISKQGFGTYVSNRYTFIGSMKSIFHFNLLAKRDVLMMDSVTDHPQMYPILGLEPDTKCYMMLAKLTINNDPVSVQKLFFPEKHFMKLEQHVVYADDLRVLFQTIYDHHILKIESDFVASEASDADAILLQIDQKDAIHFVTSRIYSKDGLICGILHALPGEYVKFEEAVR